MGGMKKSNRPVCSVTVYGAAGHTGRFVVAELVNRGLCPILCGRDRAKLELLAATHGGLEVRAASVDDPASLDRALAGAAAVINCAGPFARTAEAVIDAALRARIHYLDVAAEIEVATTTFAQYGDRARNAGIAIVPAMAFYGEAPGRFVGNRGDGRLGKRGRGFDRLRTQQLESDARYEGDERGLIAAQERAAPGLHTRPLASA